MTPIEAQAREIAEQLRIEHEHWAGCVVCKKTADLILAALRSAQAEAIKSRVEWSDVEYAVGYCCGKDRVQDVWEQIEERERSRAVALQDGAGQKE